MRHQFLLGLLITLIFIGCESKSEYQQWVDQELNTGVERDSLFMGYHFGMTRQQFYDRSWALNKQGKIMQGSGNQSVMQEMTNFDHKVKRNFYPQFYEGKIYLMPVQYSYTAWAPWNRELWSDSLITKIVDFYEDKYNENFRKMKHPGVEGEAYVFIRGNQEITIFRSDDQHVNVTFTDLEVKPEVNKNRHVQ